MLYRSWQTSCVFGRSQRQQKLQKQQQQNQQQLQKEQQQRKKEQKYRERERNWKWLKIEENTNETTHIPGHCHRVAYDINI